jgi:hypothetical protein
VRARDWFLLGLLLLSVVPPLAARGPVNAAQGLGIGLGFGPTSIEPVNLGTPVYATGDQLWAQSFYNDTAVGLTLTSPRGNVTPTVSLQPGDLAKVYTFSRNDPAGMWTLTVSTLFPPVTETLSLELANVTSAVYPTFTGATVAQNDLDLMYTLPPTSAYDVQACTVGTAIGPTASFVLPPAVGGSMAVTLSGGGASLTAPSAKVPFVAWLQLYAPRAFANGSSLVTEQLLASQTGTLNLGNSSGGVGAQLSDDMALRPGRYDLRVFVRGPSGLTSYEAPYLMESGETWISLGGCTQLADVATNPFALASSLDASNSTWPRQLITMYSQGGVESYTLTRVPSTEARIDVKSGSGGTLDGVSLALEGQGIQSWDAFGHSLYLVGTDFPVQATVVVDFEGVTSESLNLTLASPFSTGSLKVDAGVLQVQTTVQGRPLQNASLFISEVGSNPVGFVSGANGSKSLVLPPGEYNVTAAFSGKSVSKLVQVLAGETVAVALDSNPPQPPLLLYALALLLVVGIAANIYAWRAYAERRSTLA